jgi:hypothetical protein
MLVAVKNLTFCYVTFVHVSEEHIASNYTVKSEPACSSQTAAHFGQTTHHIPEDTIPSAVNI